MAGRSRYDNPFEEGGADEVNPFAVSPRLSPAGRPAMGSSTSSSPVFPHSPASFDGFCHLPVRSGFDTLLPLLLS